MGERGPLVFPIPSPQNTKLGAMERSKRLDFPMWDTPPKPMQFMPLVVCVCVWEREREIDRSSTLHLLERKEKENSHLITRIYLRVNLWVKDIDHHNVWFSTGNNVGNILGTSQQTMCAIDGNKLSIILETLVIFLA
jgi:hypothetical protein